MKHDVRYNAAEYNSEMFKEHCWFSQNGIYM